MMIRSTVIIVLLLILALPHSSVFSQTKELIIKGEIEGEIERVELYFWESKGNVRVKVDTFNLTENTFTYIYNLSESPNEVRLTNNKNRKRVTFWAENGLISFKTSIAAFNEAIVSGCSFDKTETGFNKAYDRNLPLNEQIAIIENHLDAPSALYNLYRIYRTVSVDVLNKLLSKVDRKWEGHDYLITMRNYVDLPIKNVPQKGDNLIDFQAKDQVGALFHLSEFIQQNDTPYILLEFKNHYCPYSRKAISELGQIENQYKDSITILSFITDTREFLWQQYLDADTTSWTKLWDGEGEIGKTCISYGAKGSPYYFLINKEGVIIRNWQNYAQGEIITNLEEEFKE